MFPFRFHKDRHNSLQINIHWRFTTSFIEYNWLYFNSLFWYLEFQLRNCQDLRLIDRHFASEKHAKYTTLSQLISFIENINNYQSVLFKTIRIGSFRHLKKNRWTRWTDFWRRSFRNFTWWFWFLKISGCQLFSRTRWYLCFSKPNKKIWS